MHVYIMMMMMIMTTIVKPLISRVKIVALYVKSIALYVYLIEFKCVYPTTLRQCQVNDVIE